MEIVQLAKIIPLHEVRDAAKFQALKEDMEERGWVGRPLVTYPWGDGLRALNGSHRYAAACAADLYEIPVEIIPEDALTLEQIERLDREHDTDGFARVLEEFVEEGAAGLGAVIKIMRAEAEQERY